MASEPDLSGSTHTCLREGQAITQKRPPNGGIEKCWCGKTFFWLDSAARDVWAIHHVHAVAVERGEQP